MTPHQTLAVAVRLFAIVFAIYIARELLAFYLSAREGDPHALSILATVSVLAVLFLVGLWFFPRTIARGLLPLSSDTPAQPSPPDIRFATGSVLIGLCPYGICSARSGTQLPRDLPLWLRAGA